MPVCHLSLDEFVIRIMLIVALAKQFLSTQACVTFLEEFCNSDHVEMETLDYVDCERCLCS